MHEKLIGKRCQFYIDRIQKCTTVFKLKIFNLHIQNFRYKMLFCIHLSYQSYIYLSYFELLKYPAFIVYFASLDLSIYQFIGKNKKFQHTIKFLSSREHPTVHLCCPAPTFMLFHCSLFLKFVNNFHLKLSLHFKIQCF